MDKNELERRLEAAEKQMIGLQDEIQNLKEKLSEMEQEKEIPDMPEFEHGSKLWYVDDDGEPDDCYFDSNFPADFNMFHAKEMAQEFADKCKLIAMMLHCKWYLCRDFKGDYSYPSDKWSVYYGGLKNEFLVTDSIHCDYGFVPFDTVDSAQKCADWLNKHWKENTNE